MRKSLLAAAVLLPLTLSLGGCITDGLTAKATYSADLTFDAAVKSFKAYRDLCAAGTIPASCRPYVTQGQQYIAQAYSYYKAGNSAAAQATLNSVLAIITTLKNL